MIPRGNEGGQFGDDFEKDLERRIVQAELEGRRTVADVLARELESRRKATPLPLPAKHLRLAR